MTDLTVDDLKNAADSLLARIFRRKHLVNAGESLQQHPDLKGWFQRASELYRAGSLAEARRLFGETAKEADELRPGMGLTATINIAACAAALEDFQGVVDLIRPLYERNNAFGHPLWNLALAYYRLRNLVSES